MNRKQEICRTQQSRCDPAPTPSSQLPLPRKVIRLTLNLPSVVQFPNPSIVSSQFSQQENPGKMFISWGLCFQKSESQREGPECLFRRYPPLPDRRGMARVDTSSERVAPCRDFHPGAEQGSWMPKVNSGSSECPNLGTFHAELWAPWDPHLRPLVRSKERTRLELSCR